MEIYLNNNLLKISSKQSNKIFVESDEMSKILNSNILVLNKRKFYINEISDNLENIKKNLSDGEFCFNTDMYEELIPLKYSIIKKNNNIYLFTLEVN